MAIGRKAEGKYNNMKSDFSTTAKISLRIFFFRLIGFNLNQFYRLFIFRPFFPQPFLPAIIFWYRNI